MSRAKSVNDFHMSPENADHYSRLDVSIIGNKLQQLLVSNSAFPMITMVQQTQCTSNQRLLAVLTRSLLRLSESIQLQAAIDINT